MFFSRIRKFEPLCEEIIQKKLDEVFGEVAYTVHTVHLLGSLRDSILHDVLDS